MREDKEKRHMEEMTKETKSDKNEQLWAKQQSVRCR